MEKPEVDPERTPSGKKALGYGQIVIHVWIADDTAEAMVEGHPDMPFDFYAMATTHLMSMVAANSTDGYKEAIDRLVEATLSNKGTMIIKSSEGEEDSEGPKDEKESL